MMFVVAGFHHDSNECKYPGDIWDVSGVLYNLPPHHRTSFSGMLLYALLPGKIKTYNVYYQAIFARFRNAYKGQTGFTVGRPAQRRWIEMVNKVRFLSYNLHDVLTIYQ